MGRSVSAVAVMTVYSTVITTSGTWTKDAAIQDEDDVHVHLIGGGAGGAASGSTNPGGNGGNGAILSCKGRDLPPTVACVVGAGGSTGSGGGATFFGVTSVSGGAYNTNVADQANPLNNGREFTRFSLGGKAAANSDNGAPSVYGGGGGANSGLPGGSMFAGAGGTVNADDAGLPGGGGGRQQVGKRGEIRITVTRG